MHIKLICAGKTDETWLRDGIRLYQQRLQHYISFDLIEVNMQKKWSSLPVGQQKEKEAALLLPFTKKSDMVILLDEKGKQFGSSAFATFLQNNMNRAVRNMLFMIGGPWGFSDQLYEVANMQLSLSAMTFSHQMIRLFFVEQLYRAMTILRNEGYHHE